MLPGLGLDLIGVLPLKVFATNGSPFVSFNSDSDEACASYTIPSPPSFSLSPKVTESVSFISRNAGT